METLKRRKLKYGLNAFISIVLLFGILIAINFLASKKHIKKDFTRDQLYSISDQTKKILKDMKEDVKILVFSKPTNRAPIKDVLDNYVELSNRIRVEYVDPDVSPALTKKNDIKKADTIVIFRGEKNVKVESVNEESVTNALIKLFKEKESVIYFTVNHGEKSVDDNTAMGISSIKKMLEGQTYKIANLDLLQNPKIPDDASAVIIAGPQKAFFDKEIEILNKYALSGGKLLFAIDPDVAQKGVLKEISVMLKEWGILVNNNVIIDPQSRMFGADASMPIVQLYSKTHALTRDLRQPTLFPLAIGLKVEKVNGLIIDEIAKTNQNAWGETDFKQIASGAVGFDGSDVKGPITLAVAIEGKKDDKVKDQTRIVVIGNSNFATNQYGRNMANEDFFLNAITWIAKDDNLISIRSRDGREEKITIASGSAVSIIGLVSVLLMPLALIVFGVIFWSRRRKL